MGIYFFHKNWFWNYKSFGKLLRFYFTLDAVCEELANQLCHPSGVYWQMMSRRKQVSASPWLWTLAVAKCNQDPWLKADWTHEALKFLFAEDSSCGSNLSAPPGLGTCCIWKYRKWSGWVFQHRHCQWEAWSTFIWGTVCPMDIPEQIFQGGELR